MCGRSALPLWRSYNRDRPMFARVKRTGLRRLAAGVMLTAAASSCFPYGLFAYDGYKNVSSVTAPDAGGWDTTVTKYGVGARGIDVITKKVNSGSELFGYPVYDTHGNMVATLARSGSSSYSVGNVQWYDVWGGVRSGSSSEDQGYVANLGHRTDSESDLQYMRARYYEPSTARFISEDPGRQGLNWFVYCASNPINRADPSGCMWYGLLAALTSTIATFLVGYYAIEYYAQGFARVSGLLTILAGLLIVLDIYMWKLTADAFVAAGRQIFEKYGEKTLEPLIDMMGQLRTKNLVDGIGKMMLYMGELELWMMMIQ